MIKFSIATLQNPTNQYSRGLALIPTLLDAVAQRLNSVLVSHDTNIEIRLTVDPAMQATASAGGQYISYPVRPGVQTVKGVVATKIQEGRDDNGTGYDATINLSTAFLEKLEFYGAFSSDPYTWAFTSILTHEIFHAMGVQGMRSKTTGELTASVQTAFDSHVVIKDGKPYFIGPNATALVGAAIPLTELNSPSSIYHVDNDSHPAFPNDLLNASFWKEMDVSDLDLAILKDLGYETSKLMVSSDGRTYIPSVNADGIRGQTGMDTVFYGANKSSFRVEAYGNQAALVHNALKTADVDTLVGVERIKFLDTTLAFDTNGAVGEIYRLYQAAFDRTPDLQGLGYWIRARESGVSHNTVASSFIASTEFQNLYGKTLSSTDFVTRLYANVLDRAPDAAGLNHWVSALESRLLSREQVLISFSESAENKVRTILDVDGTDAQAYRLYKAAFDRTPDIPGLIYWAGQMEGGLSLKGVAHNFLQSEEFRKLYGEASSTAQFVTLLYNNVLDRAPDPTGQSYWSDLLNRQTLSRADVLVEFSESAENRLALVGQGAMKDYVEFV